MKVFRTHYDEASLLEAIKEHDAVMSAIVTFSVQQQKIIVDAAAKVGVSDLFLTSMVLIPHYHIYRRSFLLHSRK